MDQSTTGFSEEVEHMSDVPAHVLRQAKSRDFRPSVRIGKSGLSETVLEEIRQQLQAKSLVKVKVNKGLFEREQRSEVRRTLLTTPTPRWSCSEETSVFCGAGNR